LPVMLLVPSGNITTEVPLTSFRFASFRLSTAAWRFERSRKICPTFRLPKPTPGIISQKCHTDLHGWK
jgi:hypothetical protein